MYRANKHRESQRIHAYNHMMQRIKNNIEDRQLPVPPSLQQAIDSARNQAIHGGELSHAEADEIAAYIKQDINDAAEFLVESSHDFSEWLMLDIEIIEQKILRLFLSVADTTRIQLDRLISETG